MPRILTFETSTTTCGIALIVEAAGEVEIFRRTIEGVAGHAEHLLPMASEVLALAGASMAQIDAVAFGQGPGAFTGLRLACGAAQGIGLALGIPLIPVGALPAVAAAASARHTNCLVLPALDARMQEIYLGACWINPHGGLVTVAPPVLIDAADALDFVAERLPLWRKASGDPADVVAIGEGWKLVPEAALSASGLQVDDLDARPTVDWVARLALDAWAHGQTVAPEHAAPFYLRDKVAFTTAEREERGATRVPVPTQGSRFCA
jgi:tRNA threonylcarbamoyladenosine biosynthesis protein TsaB